MTVTLDFTEDYAVWDNTEAVKLVLKRSPANGGDVTFSVATALRLPVTVREAAASGGAYTTRDTTWRVPGILTPKLNADRLLAPVPGDQVLATDNTKWTVLDVSYSPLDTTYSLTCRDLVLAHGLVDRLTVRFPVNSFDAAAGRVVAGFADGDTVRCKIHEVSGEPADERGRRGMRTRYQVFLEEPVQAGPHLQYMDQDRKVYQYVSHENADMIDQLPTLILERTP